MKSTKVVKEKSNRQYAANKILKEVRKHARKTVKKKGIKLKDIEGIIDQGRR